MKKNIFMKAVIGVLIIAMIAFTSCTQYGNQQNNPPTTNVPPATSPPSIESTNIYIKNFAFSPSSMTIKKGSTVIWTNSDSAPHTVTSDSGTELSSDQLSNGQTYSHVFNSAGTFNYHCGIHASMKAEVIVQ
jgi:plastocyanin